MNKLIAAYVNRALEVDFESQLADTNPIAISLVDRSLPWLICIGGLNQRMGMPVHEFVKVVQDTPSNRLFIRDSSRLWYQNGLPGLAGSFEEAGMVVGGILDILEAKGRMAAASSAGGFAAIGWASYLHLNELLVFSPQSSIKPVDKMMYDRRWFKFVWKSWLKIDKTLDVGLAKNFEPARNVRIIYPDGIAEDCFQASRLRDFPGVVLDPRSSKDHSIVRELRDTGELLHLLEDGLASCCRS